MAVDFGPKEPRSPTVNGLSLPRFCRAMFRKNQRWFYYTYANKLQLHCNPAVATRRTADDADERGYDEAEK